jgi:PAS domain S-box-containing protein
MNDKPPAAAALEKAQDLDDPILLEQQRLAAVADAVAAQTMLSHVLHRETDFRHLVEELPALIYRATFDGTDRSLYISPYVRTLGRTVKEWCADPQAWTDALHPEDRERTLAELEQAYAHGNEHTAEYRLRDAQGKWLYFRDHSRRLFPPDGGPAYILGIALDITDQRATQAALLTYQMELSELTQLLLTQEKDTTRRVAQSLHDNLGQTLAVARLNLELLLTTSVEDGQHKELFGQCRHIARLLEQAVQDVRHLLSDLRPPLLEEQGLAAALDNETCASPGPAGLSDVLLEVGDGLHGQRWPSDVEYSAFMVAREAIVNARVHAEASLIRVVLEGTPSSFTLDVIDDGKGISPELRQGRPGHLGVVGMRERAHSIGAVFSLVGALGGGTHARLRWEAPQP